MCFYDLYYLNFAISQDHKLIFLPKMSNFSTTEVVANHEELGSFSESTPSSWLKGVFCFLAPKIVLTGVIKVTKNLILLLNILIRFTYKYFKCKFSQFYNWNISYEVYVHNILGHCDLNNKPFIYFKNGASRSFSFWWSD